MSVNQGHNLMSVTLVARAVKFMNDTPENNTLNPVLYQMDIPSLTTHTQK